MKIWLLTLSLFVGAAFAQDVELSVQTGHADAINKVIFSPNDELLVSAGADHKIVIWDFLTAKQYGVLLGHDLAVLDIAFSADGKELYSVSQDSTLIIWDFEAEKLKKKIKFDYPIGALRFDHNREQIILVGDRICFYDLKKECVKELEFEAKNLYTAMAISDNGDLLAVGGEDEPFMYLIDLKANELLYKFVSQVKDIQFDQGKYLLFGTTDGRLVEYNLESKKRKSATTDWMLNAMNAVEANEKIVFASNNVGEIMMFNRKKKWKSWGKLKMKRGKIKDITISHNGKFIASAGANRTVVVWNVESKKVVKSMRGRVQQINDIEFSKDGAEIIIAYNNGSVRRSNLISNQTMVNSMRPKSQILSAFSSYTIQSISNLSHDTISFVSMYRINSQLYEGSYDKLQKFDIHWDLKDNVLSYEKSDANDEDIKKYMKDLKTEVFHDKSYFLDNALLKDQNDSIEIAVSVVGDELIIDDLKSGQQLHKIETNHSDRVTSVAINARYNYVATAGWDGMVHFWDIESGDLLTVYGAFGNGQFVYLDQLGYYFASKDALDYIGFKLEDKLYSFEQFDLKYNRPDIVARSLPYFNEAYIIAYEGAYKKRLNKLGLSEDEVGITTNLPVLEISDEVKKVDKTEYLSLSVHCKDNQYKLNKLHVRVNGVPEFGRFGKQLKGSEYEDQFDIKLNPGTNEVQVYVTNERGISSYKETFEIESHQKKKRSEMYLITIGVSKFQQSQYDLKYARKDAEDISSFFSREKPVVDKLHVKTLVDQEVTIENVEALKEFASRAKENDVLVLFAAGHGVLDANLDYYFAAADMDFNKPDKRGIPYDTFEQILDGSKSRKKVMFLDACHSGEIDKDEVIENVITEEVEGEIIFRGALRTVENKYDINSFDLSRSLFADMRLNNGSTVVSSAGGAEFAIEGDEWNNGVFTYSLLKGLRDGEADLNGDKVIMLSEIQAFVQKEVVKISNGLQTPTSRVENLNNDFRIK